MTTARQSGGGREVMDLAVKFSEDPGAGGRVGVRLEFLAEIAQVVDLAARGCKKLFAGRFQRPGGRRRGRRG